jgi:hypothetical protein
MSYMSDLDATRPPIAVTLDAELVERVLDWQSYQEHHPEIPYTAEWAQDMLRKIAEALTEAGY